MERPLYTAAAVGMFDGVHLGHQMLVKRLCELSAARGLSPGVFTFTDHPMAVVAPGKAPELLTTVSRRSLLLVEAGACWVVALRFDQELRSLTAEAFMRILRDRYGVRLLLIGFNHRFGSDRLSDFDSYRAIGDRLGLEVFPTPALDLPVDWEGGASSVGVDWEGGASSPQKSLPVSSSLIRSLLKSGDISGAECLLGHPFVLDGCVVHGRGLGRTIDFPTANILPYLSNQLLPKPGVYAAWMTCPAASLSLRGGDAPPSRSTAYGYPVMVNIGTNPTVSDGGALSIEAHVIGYGGDLYGLPVSVVFKARLRDECRFPDLASLTAQLVLDRETTLSVLRPRPIKNVKGWGRRCALDFVLQAKERSELRD